MTASTPHGRPAFSITEPLAPGGRLVLEASAGTGKTFTIAALVTRFVAEHDLEIGGILVVTFTRAAAAELRERIRDRLVSAAAHLQAVVALAAAPTTDELAEHLATTDVAVRLARLERAVLDFDTATITTIHGFCQQLLATTGTVGPTNPDAVLVQDTGDLVRSVVNDVLAREAVTAAASSDDEPALPVGPDKLGSLVRTVLNNPGITVRAGSGDPDDERRHRLVEEAADTVRRRLAGAGHLAFDDLLTGALAAVERPEHREQVASRFRVALIDEFQDTDPVQWSIFERVFGESPSTLVLVGDPKQAIYGFRGGDIHTYLEATSAGRAATLATNWRSDGRVVDALNRVFGDRELGDERIRYRQVEPAPPFADRRLVQADGSPVPPISIRAAVDPSIKRKGKQKDKVYADDAREAIAADLALQVARLLEGGRVLDPAADEPDQRSRSLTAGDVAVLVGAHRESPVIQAALARHGVPSVITGGETVVTSPAADQWRLLFGALARPADLWLARAAALSWFWGWSADRLAQATDDELSAIQQQHAEWAQLLRDQGAAALFARLRHDSGVTARVLARPTGERDITDLDHLGELVQRAIGGQGPSPSLLLSALDHLDDLTDENDPEAARRRVPSDAACVQIMTMHAAKGLEFGVVCLPSLWGDRSTRPLTTPYHDAELGGRVLEVGSGGPGAADAAKAGVLGEQLRLTYVALTRAKHQVLAWWTDDGGAKRSGLSRVVFGDRDGALAADVPTLDEFVPATRRLLDDRGALDVEVVAIGAPDPAEAPTPTATATPEAATLTLATLSHTPDRRAWRWSFSGLTRHADDVIPRGVADPDDESLGDTGATDEGAEPADWSGAGANRPAGTAPPAGTDDARDPVLPLDELEAGPAFGTLAHEALEAVSFDDPDVEPALAEAVRARSWRTSRPVDADVAARGLRIALETPLGTAFGGLRLRDLGDADRLNELNFELPLGLDHRVAVRGIGTLLLDALPPDDPLRPWAGDLASGTIDLHIAGHLTGSIDLVLRHPRPDGTPTFSVVDYKTNRLGRFDEPGTLADYAPDALAEAMAHHHYPLQALLYAVAVHRYLRWRQPGYDPDVHLGPVGYLFLRGMAGQPASADGSQAGVFAWHLPSGLVPALSDLLHGADREEVAS